MSVHAPSFISSIRQAMDLGLDPALVDNTPRLLDMLNRSDKLQKFLMRRDGRGYTLLHLAAERNQPESLKCLLIKEANPNVCSSGTTKEVTPLHVAAYLGNLACLQLLIQSGGDVLVTDNEQKTPLEYARVKGQNQCLNYLHDELARRQRVEARQIEEVLSEVERNLAKDKFNTLCQWQLFNELFPLSLSAGSKLSAVESVLHRHCEVNNSLDLVRAFEGLCKDIPLRVRNASLLHSAARYGRYELVRLLIERVPQIALSVSSEGYNALHIAVSHHQVQVAKLLMEKQIEWHKRANGNVGPMERSGLESSLAHGAARFATPTMSGHTVLHFAVAVNNTESLFYLLKHHRMLELSVDCHECGYSPLHLAVFLNQVDSLKMLLTKGANPSSRLEQTLTDNLSFCRTPLSEAVSHNNVELMHILLEYGAEDRHHDAMKKCLPYNRHRDLVLPLLASLVKQDDTYKPSKTSSSFYRKHKHVMLGWENLSLTEVLPNWVSRCLSMAHVLRTVERARLQDCVTYVNLSGNKLRTVPVELFLLPHMVVLNLQENLLESLPEIDKIYNSSEDAYHWPCRSLSKLYLGKNALQGLPEFIFYLPVLMHLELSHNELRELSFDLWKAPKLHTLLCSHNKIETLPTNWPHVLSSCNVVNNSPSPKSMMEAPEMKRNSSKQAGSAGHASLDNDDDKSPEEADSSSGGTPLISKLHDRLNISNSHLPVEWDGGESRDEYEGLTILDLSHNLISEVPENLPCLCPKLVRFDLSFNHISSLCFPRSFPADLKQLNFSHNQLESLNCPDIIAKPLPCTNPQILVEAGNVIYVDNVSFCLHRYHSQLVKLTVLQASHCDLNTINFYRPGPQSKQGGANDASKKPQQQVKGSTERPKPSQSPLVCPSLTRLILNNNLLLSMPLSVCEMRGLNSLDLSHNDIIHLPADMGNLSNLWEFPLEGLKLISPPQNIIERGRTKDIIGFLWSLQQRARPYHRMKLMFVGKANRGKTTLLEKISEKGQRGVKDNWGNTRMQGLSKNISTVGIVVSDWTYFKPVKESQTGLKSITFMTWDFGGQEEYYATHQCFLSRRSLYLAVWNVTHGMRGAVELKPWLLNIQARAPNSPVIIVGTHYDKLARSDKQELERCRIFIHENYGQIDGTPPIRKEGFPQIMASMVVSCVTGRGINVLRDTLFDVASQIRENIVSRQGMGRGLIPPYRLLMDQLVPASYLQLEDTVRNIAIRMKLAGHPPVLDYKKLRKEVFSDPNTLISKDSINRELDQAVRFLHDNGTMLHFEDPLLSDFYFVDPQWLCDMLAHIVTVRQINPFIKDGVMHIKDFPLIFKDDDKLKFPLQWKTKYIRLLTMFEVAVELCDDQLLIPSALPPDQPILHQVALPQDLKRLPALRHAYIVPFIPSGFWPRLMSRLLTDPSITQLARDGCAISLEECDQLNWVKWRTGMILQYGNLTLLTINELDHHGIFHSTPSSAARLYMYTEEQWQLHGQSRVSGINIEAQDVYPVLKYPEMRRRYRRVNHGVRSSSPKIVSLLEQPLLVDLDGELESSREPCDARLTNHMVNIDQIDSEFEKLRIRRDNCRNSMLGGDLGVAWDASQGRACSDPTQGVGQDKSLSQCCSATPSSKPAHVSSSSQRRLSSTRSSSSQQAPPSSSHPHTLTLSEDKNNQMRAGLLSKVIDHIILLMEDWFMGVRPKTLVVPCPHCTVNATPPVRMERSCSEVVELLPQAEMEGRGEELERERSSRREGDLQPDVSNADTSNREAHHPQDTLSLHGVKATRFRYAFRYNECVVTARKLNSMFCPAHGEIPLQYIAPDTLFLTQGKDVLVEASDFEDVEPIGSGAFATVFKAKYRNGKAVAVKALTKEWQGQSGGGGGGAAGDQMEGARRRERDGQGAPVHHPSRHSIVNGFTNVKKELAILSPLRHPHVVRLFGVMLRPMGLVLELASLGSLKMLLNQYEEVHAKFHVRAMQRVFLQVASALQYLHDSAIIYRDLKSDNILAWKFPEPRDPIPIPLGADLGMDTVLVKISDYGISQYVATQGARGLVGTAGFMAPEILKYHGKEVYNQQVDIFSFGIVIYEMLTLHIPYENLAGQQANQANEEGIRPSLYRRDFPCPVLVRELMAWCWQQLPENRPSAHMIMGVARTEQFSRLLDGIRICNSGKVTTACMRSVIPSHIGLQYRHGHILSPPPPAASHASNSSDNCQLEVVSEEIVRESQPCAVAASEVGWAAGTNSNPSGERKISGGFGGRHGDGSGSGGSGDSRSSSRKESGLTVSLSSGPRLALPPHPSLHPYFSHAHLQRQLSSDELGAKRLSPYFMSDDGEGPLWEVWVASSNAHHSTLTVIDYAQTFLTIEDVELGDSPVLCMCVVQRKVWLGLEMGALVVYDANTRKPYLQTVIKHCKSIQAMLHLPPLHHVYLGLEDGSVLAFHDELPAQPLISIDPSLTNPPLVQLSSVAHYRDRMQTSACFLALPGTSVPAGANQHNTPTKDVQMSVTDCSSGKRSYELWVGQKDNRITVLDASSLKVLKFLQNPLDQSTVPSYIAHLSCSHLVSSTWDIEKGVVDENSGCGFVNVYSALYHGQYVTRWNSSSKEAVESFNCRPHSQDRDCCITALLYSKLELTIGLSSGLILILDPLSFHILCSLSCHRQQVSCLLSLQMPSSHYSQQQHMYPPSSSSSSSSSSREGTMLLDGVVATGKTCRSNTTPRATMGMGSVRMSSSTGCSDRLLSFGTGFKSYYDEMECKQKHGAGFLLVWESDHWRSCPNPVSDSEH